MNKQIGKWIRHLLTRIINPARIDSISDCCSLQIKLITILLWGVAMWRGSADQKNVEQV